MNILKKIKKIVKNPMLILVFLDSKKIIRLKDKKYLEIHYTYFFDEKVNFSHPKKFNEKIQWLKLYDRKDIYTTMVDKYAVKKYVSDLIGEKYVIPTIGAYDNFDEIDFDKLPEQFVIKTNHYGGGGGVFVVKDKKQFDIDNAKKNINNKMKKNLYYYGREWPYKNIKPKIIVEKYMVDESGKELKDYKFFCFNGKVKIFKVDFNRFIKHQANYYDTNLKLLPFGESVCPPNFDKKIKFPNNIDEMIFLAEKLAKDIPFVRVDFYNVNGKVYFGEMTFYPASGFGKFTPKEWDCKLGDMLDLSVVSDGEN